MPNPIKTSDLVQKGLMNEPIKNLKEYDALLGKVELSLKEMGKKMQQAFKKADFKSTKGVKEFKTNLTQLSEVEKQYQKTLKQS